MLDRLGNRVSARTALIAVALAFAAAGTACGGSARPSTAGQRGGELVWGVSADADVIDPAPSNTALAWQLVRLPYEGLVGLDDHLKLVPELAESWRQTSPTTYVFTLRKGVKFSNGREMTVDDVVGSLDRLIDPKSASSWAGLVGIRSVAAVGTTQVKVTLAAPRTSFLAALAGAPVAVLPMKELKAGTFDPKKEMVGTGPFKVVAHSQGESWTFGRNPYYWRPGLPKVDKLTVRAMPEDTARVAALRQGTVDITTFENPDALRLLKGQPNVTTMVQSTTDFYRLDVNALSSLFRDDRLRQALALSIDRNKIKDVALGGIGRPTAAVSAPFGVCDPATLPYATPDLARAKQLVKAAGATGKTVTILTTSVVPMSAAIAQVIQKDLEPIGLKVRIQTVDIGELFKRAYSGKADFDVIVSWFAGYADPGMTPMRWNPDLTLWDKGFVRSEPQLNKLLATSTATPAGPERTTALQAVCERIARGANIIPLVTKDLVVAYRSDRVSPRIFQLDGYAVPLRQLAQFTRK